MSSNRFSILDLDDEDTEIQKPIPKAAEPIKEVREWKRDDGKPAEVRKWNLEESKFEQMRRKKPFHRGYAFKDDTRPATRPMRGYSFKDESPPPDETIKPGTPEEFPRLCEEDSHTPPYPPSNSPVQTLAERIRQTMERQTQSKQEENTEDTLEMYSVIPMKTRLSGSLTFIGK